MALTQKQEIFCCAYVETGNASDAYRRSYNTQRMKPETINRNAKALLDNNKIATRLEEMRVPVREAACITLASHLSELARLRDDARNAGNFTAAISAEISRGKASGLYVSRREINDISEGPLEPPIFHIHFTDKKPLGYEEEWVE